MTNGCEKNNKILAKTEKMYYICTIDSFADAQSGMVLQMLCFCIVQ